MVQLRSWMIPGLAWEHSSPWRVPVEKQKQQQPIGTLPDLFWATAPAVLEPTRDEQCQDPDTHNDKKISENMSYGKFLLNNNYFIKQM